MAVVKVLIEGFHANRRGLLKIASTTTLIRSNKNIIVDPGAYVNQAKLTAALKKEGLSLADIDCVILTHTHLDHSCNVFLFPNARIYSRFISSSNYPGQFQSFKSGTLKRYDLINSKIARDVKVLDTPGHTNDSICVLVNTKDGVVAIAGDAISGKEWADITRIPNKDFIYNTGLFLKSRNTILAMADWIIPGHGGLFENNQLNIQIDDNRRRKTVRKRPAFAGYKRRRDQRSS